METLRYPIRSDKFGFEIQVSAVLADVTSAYQRIQILDTPAFGRILLLDGHIQLTELDEAAYHESLVHIPLGSVPEPRRVLVIGGGDGGVLREVLKHPSIERVDMIEIDEAVVTTCQEFMPFVSDGAFDDPRVHLTIGDAFPYVKQDLQPYDLIVVDSTDTYEDENDAISEMLFTKEFYEDCRRLLSPTGMLITQADNLVFCPYSLAEIQSLLGSVFAKTGSYSAIIPSFGGYSGYCWASHGAEPAALMPEQVRDLGLRCLTPAAWAFGLAPVPFVRA